MSIIEQAAEGDIARCLETIEGAYDFTCEAGPLSNCAEWKYLKRLVNTRSPATAGGVRDEVQGRIATMQATDATAASGVAQILTLWSVADHQKQDAVLEYLDRLNAVAPAVENLACQQEQCDHDGVMVKVSRQALCEVLEAVNDLAVMFATAPPSLPLLGEVVQKTLTAEGQHQTEQSVPATKSGIYIASKTRHADRWRFLRDMIGEPIISTWIDEAGEGESADLHDLWSRCLSEAANCRLLIAYRERDEIFKGGWVEIGAALSSNIPVYAVGLEEFTIAKYRGIQHFPDMKSAIAASRKFLRTEVAETDADAPGDAGLLSGASSDPTPGALR